jgi:hypothetical protein
MSRSSMLAWFVGLALTAATPALAQVNTERLRPRKEAAGLHGFVEGSVSWLTGNTSVLLATLGARLEYTRGVHSPFLQGSYALGAKDGSEFINAGFLHARWPAMWLRRVGTEVFTQVQFDNQLRMHLRALAGAGLRLVLVRNRRLAIYLGTGYMFEYEQLDIPATDPHPHTTRNHRSTSYLLTWVSLSRWLKLVVTTYVQPRFDDAGDFRFLEDLTLAFDLRKDRLKLHVNFLCTYDSDPPSQVQRVDTRLVTKLKLVW